MIIARFGVLFLGIIIFLGAVELVTGWFPCPDPTPPAGLGGVLSTQWSWYVWIACLVYTAIPVREFKFWAEALPVGFILTSILAYYLAGDFSHALFLTIHGIIAIMLTTVASVIVTTVAQMFNWGAWLRFVIVPMIAYVAVTSWAYIQAIGFSQSVC